MNSEPQEEELTPVEAPPGPRIYVLGGNSSTLAFVSSLVPERRQVTAWLVPLAWTPVGVAAGESWQRVGIPADNVVGWADQTFSPEDERSFVTSGRDLELLMRVGWSAPAPTAEDLSDKMVLNLEDVPEDVLDAFAQPLEALTQCAICRRTCVRDHFVWNERRLCAWDYHATVFGKRGPWRDGTYEERLFETLPHAAYVAPGLLDEQQVDPVMAVSSLPEDVMRALLNAAIEGDAGHPHIAVRTEGGYTLLRERGGS